jgi:ribosomal protein S18 acetylase RimI-like enzyme
MLKASLVKTNRELDQIAELSRANLVSEVSAETKAKEGFVTWVYTPEILRALHAIVPSVIVKDGDVLAGYALTLTAACADIYPIMKATLEHMNGLSYKGRLLGDRRIYLMGQICVDKAYRGQGVVEQLYRAHREYFSDKFDLLVTEISAKNPRSLKAHQKAGFEVIDTYPDNGEVWDVVLLDWGVPA